MKTCDGIDNCEDGSDEDTILCGTIYSLKFQNKLKTFANIILDVNECEPINPCAHVCVDKPIGYECRCNAGFKPNPKDAHLCSDIDECSEHPIPCSQICRNTFGSYNCSCTDGYLPIHNGHSCKTNSSKKSKSFF